MKMIWDNKEEQFSGITLLEMRIKNLESRLSEYEAKLEKLMLVAFANSIVIRRLINGR